jgi:hypothetical protein
MSGEPTLASERSNENRLSAGDHTAKQWHMLLLSLCSTRPKSQKRSAPDLSDTARGVMLQSVTRTEWSLIPRALTVSATLSGPSTRPHGHASGSGRPRLAGVLPAKQTEGSLIRLWADPSALIISSTITARRSWSRFRDVRSVESFSSCYECACASMAEPSFTRASTAATATRILKASPGRVSATVS